MNRTWLSRDDFSLERLVGRIRSRRTYNVGDLLLRGEGSRESTLQGLIERSK